MSGGGAEPCPVKDGITTEALAPRSPIIALDRLTMPRAMTSDGTFGAACFQPPYGTLALHLTSFVGRIPLTRAHEFLYYPIELMFYHCCGMLQFEERRMSKRTIRANGIAIVPDAPMNGPTMYNEYGAQAKRRCCSTAA